jgi:hypothetical protein
MLTNRKWLYQTDAFGEGEPTATVGLTGNQMRVLAAAARYFEEAHEGSGTTGADFVARHSWSDMQMLQETATALESRLSRG